MSSKVHSTLFAAFGCATFGLTLAPPKLLGLFFIHMQREFSASARKVSMCIGLISALSFLYGPLDAIIYNQLGVRGSVLLGAASAAIGLSVSPAMSTLNGITVVYALFTAFGVGLTNISLYTMSGQVFSCRLSLVNNLLSSSHSVVTFALAPITQFLIMYFGWRGTLLLLGGITLHAVPFSLLATRYYNKIQVSKTRRALKQTKGDCENHIQNDDLGRPHTQEKHNRRSLYETFIAAKVLLGNPYFVIYMTSMTFATASRLSVLLYSVRYAQSTGISDKNATWILSLQELLSVISGPLAGYLTSTKSKYQEDRMPKKDGGGCVHRASESVQYIPRSYAQAILSALFSVSILIPVAFQTYLGFMTSGVLNGIIMGANTALPITVLTDFFKDGDLVTAQGLRCLLAGIGSVSYPWIVGTIIDVTGSYVPAQISAASCSLISSILTVITQIGLTRKAKSGHMEHSSARLDDTKSVSKESQAEDESKREVSLITEKV